MLLRGFDPVTNPVIALAVNGSIIKFRKRFLPDTSVSGPNESDCRAMDKTTKFCTTAMKYATNILLLIVASGIVTVAGGASEAQVADRRLPSAEHPAAVAADPPMPFPTVLYGAAYYHEYEPYERLDQDVKLMKDAGLNVVRMGESTWSLWEPEDGHFQYEWMDRVVNAMGKAGIKVILGTPTYSIPTWLYREHPEILARPLGGEKSFYGMRQNMDIQNVAFRSYSQRLIENLV